ncbi:sulfite exporter TauE/SafE family protein [Bradymonas sediminis]|uniref:Probable membrane transporter protein n=2 Tax=Bradymonas sediminis TaxID=1548548 RepID=A0A2Z4FLP9_9DELT|nr:sulfite exporter TauE/SafE family protein [Bradymonas sediminis]
MTIALIGGICITTIGPGGIFVTIALFALLDLTPSTVAGTASATFIATGIVGSLAYLRSGELSKPGARRAALVLGAASVIGAFAGAQLNTILDARLFGIMLGAFVLLTGLIILIRRVMGLSSDADFELNTPKADIAMVAIGLGVGLPGGLLGVGGPVLAVPIMVVLGVPMLVGVALAQVQSIFIAAFATVGFAIHGAIDWSLALLVGVPLLIGTVAGWYLARRINPDRLQLGLAAVLIGLGAYLLIGGGTLN